MIESFKKTLHLKILVYQLDINKQMLYESLMQDNKLPADFDINQRTFNKHYEQCYQKLNLEVRSPKKGKQSK
jgi:hypothetical protein